MRRVLDAAVCTHEGRVRNNNEDNFYLMGRVREDVSQSRDRAKRRSRAEQALFAVADGMGGEADGERASLIAVKNLCPCGMEELREVASGCIRQANREICYEIEHNSGRRMGSTLAALYIEKNRAALCNVGDSRGYLLRRGELRQLTEDHTRVRQMVRMGLLTPEQAAVHRDRHILSQNLGIFEDEMILEPWFSETVTLEAGDVFLLCSDGLTDMVTEPEIQAALAGKNAGEMAARLVELALERGGKDNVTVLVVKVEQSRFPF